MLVVVGFSICLAYLKSRNGHKLGKPKKVPFFKSLILMASTDSKTLYSEDGLIGEGLNQ